MIPMVGGILVLQIDLKSRVQLLQLHREFLDYSLHLAPFGVSDYADSLKLQMIMLIGYQ